MLGIRRHKRERALADALAASLDAVRCGSASVDECLQRYPAFAVELAPLLQTSARMQIVSRIQPSEQARLNARFALQQAAAATSRPVPIAPRAAVRRRAWLALAPAAMAALLFAAIAVPVLGSVDSNAVPGDWNYSFKRATERVRLALATDSTDRRLLRLEFASRRLTEIERLSSHGQAESHASEVTSLLKDYTADLNQVKSSSQAEGQVTPAIQQHVAAVVDKADVVLPQIVDKVPDEKSTVKTAARDAVDVTKETQSVAAALPTPNTKPSSQPAKTPATAMVAAAPPAATTTSAPTDTPSPTATSAAGTAPTPAPATVTPSASPTVPPTIAPTIAPAASPTQPPEPTREAAALPVVIPTGTPPTRTSTSPTAVDTSTPAAEQPAAATPARALSARPAATDSPSPVPTVDGSNASPSPTRTATASPGPAATRAASTAGALVVVDRASDTIVYRWLGAPSSLAAVVASLGDSVANVTYQTAGQPALIWFPGSPPPVIGTNSLITVKLKTLAKPATSPTP